jgi:DnaJ-class molecular chaperone
MNFYAVLGVARDADEETIRSAYRILARQYHPDRGTGSSVEKFRQINEAYETLIDSGSRNAYDLSLHWNELIPVKVEPLVARSGPFLQEDAAIFGYGGDYVDHFGRFERPRGISSRPRFSFDMFCDDWLDSVDELIFGLEWFR